MKRFLIGVALLAVLLLCGVLSTIDLSQSFEPMAEQLQRASRAALDENWQDAQALTQMVQQQWLGHWTFTAVFSDHEPMEQIDGLFAQLEVYSEKEQTTYAALCARLAQELTDLGEDHIFTWWNLL